jgi:hypothetical protein
VTYKRKVAVLSALVTVLALVYILTLVFDREYRRSDTFAWLDSQLIFMADRIEISGPQGNINLNRRNNIWFFDAGYSELPVRQSRVDDLFAMLSARGAYPQRAASPEAIARLGLTEETAHRIRVRGGAGLPLLDLLIGGGDVLGREVYLRMSGRNQVHSGEDTFTLFTDSRPAFWYDLRLFEPFSIDMVQEAEITFPGAEALSLRRSRAGWVIPGNESVSLAATRVEAWLRSVIEAHGEDFVPDAPEHIEGRIILRLGDGTSRTLEAGPLDEQRNRRLVVSGSPFVYLFSDWAFNRIFRESYHFIDS